jgi:hypothetical protein
MPSPDAKITKVKDLNLAVLQPADIHARVTYP